MLAPGQIIDRYTVEAVLGEGGMAVVYRVRHRALGTVHALKVLTINNSSVRERFLAEGRVQARLNHANIVGVHDVIALEDGTPALLMEWIDGPSLDGWLGEHQPDPAEAEAIFRGIVAGVAHAHALGMVHRDLKPANILIDRSTGEVVPKVADFGLVKLLGEEGSRTRTGLTMGTPAYMAPEQMRNAKAVDQRADVFSLGCVLYELLVGRSPFAGDDFVAILTAAAAGTYERVPSLVAGVPMRLSRVVDACLIADRDQRLADCDAIVAALDAPEMPVEPMGPLSTAVRIDKVASATPAPAVRRETTLADTARKGLPLVLVAALGAVFVVVLGGIGVVMVYWPPASAPVDVPDPTIAEPDPTIAGDVPVCAGEEGVLVGYARANPFLLTRGATWTPMAAKPVYADRARKENDWSVDQTVVCVIPKGSKVKLADGPVAIRGTGTWIPIMGGSVRAPE